MTMKITGLYDVTLSRLVGLRRYQHFRGT